MFWPHPMALLDDLFSGVVNAVAGDKAPALNQFVQSSGGLSGLAATFQRGGAGEPAGSAAGALLSLITQKSESCLILLDTQRYWADTKSSVEPALLPRLLRRRLPRIWRWVAKWRRLLRRSRRTSKGLLHLLTFSLC